MARKTIASLDAEKTVSLGKDTKYVEGFYLGSKEIPNKKSKTGFQSIHVFETADGTIATYGFKQLNDSLAQCTTDVMTYITYKGKTTLKNGNTMHLVKVEQDDEIKRDGSSFVEGLQSDFEGDVDAPSEVESSYVPDESELEAADEEEEQAQKTPVRPPVVNQRAAATVSAEQQAKAKALLAKHRK